MFDIRKEIKERDFCFILIYTKWDTYSPLMAKNFKNVTNDFNGTIDNTDFILLINDNIIDFYKEDNFVLNSVPMLFFYKKGKLEKTIDHVISEEKLKEEIENFIK